MMCVEDKSSIKPLYSKVRHIASYQLITIKIELHTVVNVMTPISKSDFEKCETFDWWIIVN